MPKLNPYLSFDGTTGEAMRFYEKALGARLDALMTFGDMPEAMRMPGANADKVLHAQLSFGNGAVLMASDWIGQTPYQGMKGFSVALAYDTADEAKRAFDVLASDGAILLPLQPSFFAKSFGMLIDRFGTPWSISGGATRA
ncbi:MAG: VOC family protein [Parvibaculaceae bacterium]